MKQLGTIIDFDIPSKSGVINLEDGSNINFLQENISLNVKGELLLNKPVIVYHEKFRVSNVIPQDHMSYNEEDKVVRSRIEVPVTKTSSSSGSDLLTYLPWGLLSILMVLWVVFGDGKEIISSFMKNINLSTDISQYECSDVVDLVKGEELQNAFGGKFKILFIEDVKLISKNNNKIICSGKLKLSNGSDQIMKLSVTKNSDSEIYYEVSP